eukprot:c17150_g1_i2.p1 GENE.c17150_g1_i2~~c17150_g1_i2.p1  ORF type:complete len:102 (+),score=24.58 c17150_g1_i2:318-623(+)
MNELVDESSGILVKPEETFPYHAQHFKVIAARVSPLGIIEAVKKVLGMSISQRKKMGKNARKKYEDDTNFFSETIKKLECVEWKKLKMVNKSIKECKLDLE